MECQRLDTCQALIAGASSGPRLSRFTAAVGCRCKSGSLICGLGGRTAVIRGDRCPLCWGGRTANTSFGDNRCLMIQLAKVLKQKHRRGCPRSLWGLLDQGLRLLLRQPARLHLVCLGTPWLTGMKPAC